MENKNNNGKNINSKPTIVIFTGTDGVGKTTIKKQLEKKSNYKYIVLDRFTDSIVYDKLYDRYDIKEREKMFFEFENNLSKIADVYLVYLYCSNKEEQAKRLKMKNEDKDIVKKILKAEKLFKNYISRTCFTVITVDTSKLNVEDSVSAIINELKENGSNTR